MTNDTSKPGLIVVVTGLSGSGKTCALKNLEDNGYMAIDNLPALLLSKFLALRKESSGDFIKLAVGMDGRDPDLTREFEKVFREAREMGYELRVLFLEADDNALVKRFSETRRSHPLAGDMALNEAIRLERKNLAPLREISDLIIDTSEIKAPKLRELVLKRYVNAEAKSNLSIEVLSFGFKKGIPPEADLVLDVRFVPNPFYVDKLRYLDGRDAEVKNYVLSFPVTLEFLTKLSDMLLFLIPLYRMTGKSYLTIAMGCTGGQHRSVALAEHLWEKLRLEFGDSGSPVALRHRDIV
ncbi:MAG: RNase adapter RapZ [Deltaproteobacteria bacterium]|jgi:UPF0042 nucleotide-binding protein|nr:RNase adapter RapZ [Deltaproteobacteria bacterium]